MGGILHFLLLKGFADIFWGHSVCAEAGVGEKGWGQSASELCSEASVGSVCEYSELRALMKGGDRRSHHLAVGLLVDASVTCAILSLSPAPWGCVGALSD